jgi:hypothetical protein
MSRVSAANEGHLWYRPSSDKTDFTSPRLCNLFITYCNCAFIRVRIYFGLFYDMLKSARYYIDRAEIVVLPQMVATTACSIQEESSGGWQISKNGLLKCLRSETWASGSQTIHAFLQLLSLFTWNHVYGIIESWDWFFSIKRHSWYYTKPCFRPFKSSDYDESVSEMSQTSEIYIQSVTLCVLKLNYCANSCFKTKFLCPQSYAAALF